MKDQFLKEGRINQKLQTRSEILKSAQILLNKERQITLEKVAEHAGISRATIYRYFSNIELLTTEAPRLDTIWVCCGVLVLFAAAFFVVGQIRFRNDGE
mgnify:CR=1 FL=1